MLLGFGEPAASQMGANLCEMGLHRNVWLVTLDRGVNDQKESSPVKMGGIFFHSDTEEQLTNNNQLSESYELRGSSN